MHAHLYVPSSLFKRFLPHSNILKCIFSLTNVSYVTEGFSYYASFFASFSLFMFLWTHYDSISSVELSSTLILFYFPLSVEQTCDKFSSTRNYYDFLSYVEQMWDIGICFVPVISVITGKSLGNQFSLYTSQAVLIGKSNCRWDHVWASSSHNFYKAISQTPW